MRTVFTNAMCAHVFAQQSQATGRSGSTHFEGDTFYSYATPVARIVRARVGPPVMLVGTYSYSVTTSRHVSNVTRAFKGDSFRVPSIGVTGGRYYGPLASNLDHRANLDHLIARYQQEKTRLRRARDVYGTLTERLAYAAQDAHGYAYAFRFKLSLDVDGDARAIEAFRAEREARLNTPAKREEHKAEARLAYAASAERIQAWAEGKPVYLNFGEQRNANGSALLRLRGLDTVETSLGATCPLDHALRAFAVVARCREAATAWEANGGSIRVGHFHVDRISAEGNVHAGCHYLEWSVMDAFVTAVTLTKGE